MQAGIRPLTEQAPRLSPRGHSRVWGPQVSPLRLEVPTAGTAGQEDWAKHLKAVCSLDDSSEVGFSFFCLSSYTRMDCRVSCFLRAHAPARRADPSKPPGPPPRPPHPFLSPCLGMAGARELRAKVPSRGEGVSRRQDLAANERRFLGSVSSSSARADIKDKGRRGEGSIPWRLAFKTRGCSRDMSHLNGC